MDSAEYLLAQRGGQLEFHVVDLPFPLAHDRVCGIVDESFVERVEHQGVEPGAIGGDVVVGELSPKLDIPDLRGSLGVESESAAVRAFLHPVV